MSFEALKMGNYGGYVWSAYGLTFVALVVMVVIARSAAKRELRTALRRVQINAMHSTQAGEAQSMNQGAP